MGWFRRGIQRAGRSVLYRLVFSLPDSFWKEIQDKAGSVSMYEVACLHRILLKEKGDSQEAKAVIDFAQAFRSWERAKYWSEAVEAADRDRRGWPEDKGQPGDENQVSRVGDSARHVNDGSDQRLHQRRPQKLTLEYLERRGRELGL